MKLLWHGEWIETPGYEVPEEGVLIEVSAAVPLVTLKNASGRQQRRPGRKVAVFLITDGPRSHTAQSQDQAGGASVHRGSARHALPSVRWSGPDAVWWHRPTGPRLLPAVGRAPDLVARYRGRLSAADLQGVAARLVLTRKTLNGSGRQSFLYSGMKPPTDLVGLLASALARPGRSAGTCQGHAGAAAPPRGERAADTVLRLRVRAGRIRDASRRPRRRGLYADRDHPGAAARRNSRSTRWRTANRR